MRFLAILAAVLACSEAQEASAATLKSVYYFNSDDEILAQPDPDGDSISLYTEVPQFDPSLGTLTGVALQLDAYSGPTASIYVVLSGGHRQRAASRLILKSPDRGSRRSMTPTV